MSIEISAQHFTLGSNIQQYIRETLKDLATKYLASDEMSIEVKFNKPSEPSHLYHCHIIYHSQSLHVNLNSEGEDYDAYSAFKEALSTLRTQILKHKDKHNTSQRHAKLVYTEALPATDASANGKDEDAGNRPLVIKDPLVILSLEVREAVHRMEEADMQIIIFRNSETMRINVMYRDAAGDLVWSDTEAQG